MIRCDALHVGAAALIALPSNDGNDSILVILHQHRAQVVNPDVWENFEGLRWQQFGILVVKSTNHFFAGFAPIAEEAPKSIFSWCHRTSRDGQNARSCCTESWFQAAKNNSDKLKKRVCSHALIPSLGM